MAGRFVVFMILLTSVNIEGFNHQNKPLLSYFGEHNDDYFNNNTSFNISKTTIHKEEEYDKNFDVRQTKTIANITPNENHKRNENNNAAKSVKIIKDSLENQETSTLYNSESTITLNEIEKSNVDTINEKTTKNIINTELITHREENINKPRKLDEEDINTASSQIYTSYSLPTYQVHENIIDIPDDRQPTGPVVANYTKKPNFNTIIPTERSLTKTRSNNKNLKKQDDLLDFEIDYDDIKNFSNNKCNKNKVNCLVKGIKDYFSGLHKDFVNGFHNIFKHN